MTAGYITAFREAAKKRGIDPERGATDEQARNAARGMIREDMTAAAVRGIRIASLTTYERVMALAENRAAEADGWWSRRPENAADGDTLWDDDEPHSAVEHVALWNLREEAQAAQRGARAAMIRAERVEETAMRDDLDERAREAETRRSRRVYQLPLEPVTPLRELHERQRVFAKALHEAIHAPIGGD